MDQHKPGPLPRIAKSDERCTYCRLMLGLDRLFRDHMSIDGFNAREALELRPIFQCIMLNHSIGRRSSAHHIAKAIGIPRTTVQRCLDALLRIGWVERHRSHYWISEMVARRPIMPRAAYRHAAKLIADANKALRKHRT